MRKLLAANGLFIYLAAYNNPPGIVRDHTQTEE